MILPCPQQWKAKWHLGAPMDAIESVHNYRRNDRREQTQNRGTGSELTTSRPRPKRKRYSA